MVVYLLGLLFYSTSKVLRRQEYYCTYYMRKNTRTSISISSSRQWLVVYPNYTVVCEDWAVLSRLLTAIGVCGCRPAAWGSSNKLAAARWLVAGAAPPAGETSVPPFLCWFLAAARVWWSTTPSSSIFLARRWGAEYDLPATHHHLS